MMKRIFLRVCLAAGAMGLWACTATVSGEAGSAPPPTEHCRTHLRNRGEVESCRTRCGDEGCRTRCVERERVAREQHCWVE